MNIIEEIKNTKPEELNDLLLALTARYRELYPDWEIHIVTLEKKNITSQIDEMIDFLKTMK